MEPFEQFWSAYPRRDDRFAAEREFRRVISGCEVDWAEVVAAAVRYASGTADRERRFVKLPSTWLRDRCWADSAPSLEQSTREVFLGPQTVRETLVAQFGEAWTRSYLDPAEWCGATHEVIPATGTAYRVLNREAASVLKALGIG